MKSKPVVTAKPALSAAAIIKLRRVAAHILAEPHRYDQNIASHPADTCGSCGCILGWIVALYPPTIKESRAASSAQKASERYHGILFWHAAAKLGLDHDPAERLWSSGLWPIEHRDDYARLGPLSKGRARVAAKRINHFIKTDGKE